MVVIREGRQSEIWEEKVDDKKGNKETREARLKKKGCHTLTEEDTDWHGEQEEQHRRVRGEKEAKEKVGGKNIQRQRKDSCNLE